MNDRVQVGRTPFTTPRIPLPPFFFLSHWLATTGAGRYATAATPLLARCNSGNTHQRLRGCNSGVTTSGDDPTAPSPLPPPPPAMATQRRHRPHHRHQCNHDITTTSSTRRSGGNTTSIGNATSSSPPP